MTTDAQVQHTWNLTHDTNDRISIDLWTDGYSVRVDGGPDDGHEDDRGRRAGEERLAPHAPRRPGRAAAAPRPPGGGAPHPPPPPPPPAPRRGARRGRPATSSTES